MKWENYRYNFITEAKKSGKSDIYCSKWLTYAETLYKNNVPIIYTQDHLSKLLGYQPKYLYAASNCPRRFYRQFEIPKKSGGTRRISEPLPTLKDIQRWILDNILSNIKVSPYAKAYIKGISIKENVKFHRCQQKVFSVDIKDFFDNLSSWLVYQTFLDVGYSNSVSIMLTNLCCLNGCLPQGAPTSSMLSNIILTKFDYAIAAYTTSKKIRYTRYADDMTFSGDFNEFELLRCIRENLTPFGLKINNNKTRLRKKGQQQEVTGIIVNNKPQLSKLKRKEIRKNVYYIHRYGLESHLNYIQEDRKNYLQHLYGEIGFALFINPKDQELQKYKTYLNELMAIH